MSGSVIAAGDQDICPLDHAWCVSKPTRDRLGRTAVACGIEGTIARGVWRGKAKRGKVYTVRSATRGRLDVRARLDPVKQQAARLESPSSAAPRASHGRNCVLEGVTDFEIDDDDRVARLPYFERV